MRRFVNNLISVGFSFIKFSLRPAEWRCINMNFILFFEKIIKRLNYCD